MRDPLAPAIGGYFELELGPGRGVPHARALQYRCARAAFLDLLVRGRPTNVWLPWYLCDSMVRAAKRAGVGIRRYRLDERLHVLDAAPEAGDWLLCVNYFGLCERAVSDAVARFGAHRVVVDNSQALFSPAGPALATIYSPRKFVGIPDGGQMVTTLFAEEPAVRDTGSVEHCRHLLERLAGDVERGHADFTRAEERLDDDGPPLAMSTLTRRLMAAIDFDGVRQARTRHFTLLQKALGPSNGFDWTPADDSAPLCYPYGPVAPGMREALREQRIYTPCYWPEVAADAAVPAFEASLARDTLFLPCDQRLTADQLSRLIDAVQAASRGEPAQQRPSATVTP
ncbi:hypothetical protein [uncultured Pseudacidovorax sp.]|uniref:hypothetical protein n=1 Tax=uncultured Pseudacidovorax sp. TaxID=679313 RepID=UPI0025D2FA88|nr:hypothetical protein [uncultured Pseudacidovorax sp.]